MNLMSCWIYNTQYSQYFPSKSTAIMKNTFWCGLELGDNLEEHYIQLLYVPAVQAIHYPYSELISFYPKLVW